jgi:DNA anti-recombination protein RmuC
MKTIESILDPIRGYLISITRNPMEGWYEMEIGIPKGWVFDENKEIKCEILSEEETGKLIKISPKNIDIVIDDLVAFIVVIIATNKKIADKEKQFTDKMAVMRNTLEKEVKEFYEELDEIKENSFKNLNAEFEKSLRPEGEETKRHRSTKAEMETKRLANITTTNTGGATETVNSSIKEPVVK